MQIGIDLNRFLPKVLKFIKTAYIVEPILFNKPLFINNLSLFFS